jgi:hypothetical protein
MFYKIKHEQMLQNYKISALLNPSGYIKNQDCALEMDKSVQKHPKNVEIPRQHFRQTCSIRVVLTENL